MGDTHSNRARVLMPSLGLLVVLWSYLTYDAWRAYERDLDTGGENLTSLCQAVLHHFEGVLHLTEAVLRSADRWAIEHPHADLLNAPEIVALNRDLLRDTDGMVHLRLIDEDGFLERIGDRDFPPVDVRQRDYFQAQIDPLRHGFYIGAPVFAPYTNDWVIPVTLPSEQQGRHIVLYAGIRLSNLLTMHEQHRPKASGGIMVIRHDGIVLSRAPHVEGLRGKDVANSSEYRDHFSRMPQGVFRTPASAIDGQHRLVSFVVSTDYPLILATSLTYADVLAGWRQGLWRLTAVACLVTLGTVFFATRLAHTLDAAKSAQEATESAFRRFSDIVATASDLVWEIDEGLRLTFTSTQYRAIVGLPPEVMLGKRPSELGLFSEHPEVREELLALVEARRPFDGHHVAILSPDGRRHLMQLAGRPFYRADGSFAGYRGTMTDITDVQSWRIFRTLIEAPFRNHVGQDFMRRLLLHLVQLAEADAALIGQLGQDNRLTTVHAWMDGSFVENFSYTVSCPFDADVFKRELCVCQGEIATQSPAWRSFCEAGPRGCLGKALYDSKGSPFGLLLLLGRSPIKQTQTVELLMRVAAPRAAAELERTLAENALRESEARLQAALDHLPFDLWIVGRDECYQLQNATSLQRFGNLCGQSLQAMHPNPALAQRWVACRDQVLTGKVVQQEIRARFDGEMRSFIEILAPILAGREVIGAMGIHVDITDRKRLEQEARRRSERRAQASKMQALGELAGGIAHDFNTLLEVILGFAQFLLEDLPADAPQRRFVGQIVTAGERGKALGQQILTFVRGHSIDPAPLRAGEFISECVDLLSATLPETTGLVVGNIDPVAMFLGDRAQMTQVVINLCINASDALGGTPGKVFIDVEPLDRSRPELARLPAGKGRPSPMTVYSGVDDGSWGWIATGAVPDGQVLVLRVTDSGSGIPSGARTSLFDPFFTTKAYGHGTGLGLPVVHRIVTEHGGAVLVRTKVEHGASFEVLLPSAPVRQASGESAAARTATILALGEDAKSLGKLSAGLRRMGHIVVATNNPEEGLQAIEESPDLWDIVMVAGERAAPRLASVTNRIKELQPSIGCIVCTSDDLGRARTLWPKADGFAPIGWSSRAVDALVKSLLVGPLAP